MSAYFAQRTSNLPGNLPVSSPVFLAIAAQVQAWIVGVPIMAVLDDSSADGLYLAYVVFVWVFSVLSIFIEVCPKIVRTIRIKHNPELGSDQPRVRLSLVGHSGGSGRRIGSPRDVGLSWDSASSSFSLRKANPDDTNIVANNDKNVVRNRWPLRSSHQGNKQSLPSAIATKKQPNTNRVRFSSGGDDSLDSSWAHATISGASLNDDSDQAKGWNGNADVNANNLFVVNEMEEVEDDDSCLERSLRHDKKKKNDDVFNIMNNYGSSDKGNDKDGFSTLNKPN